MNQNIELLQYLYHDTEMASFTITELLKDLNDKDNHIKRTLEEILKDYQEYNNKIKRMLEETGEKPKATGMMSKMGAGWGIKKEVTNDNSDASIAGMMIQGITMGTVDVEKRIHTFDDTVTKKSKQFAQEILKFETEAIEKLKKYL